MKRIVCTCLFALWAFIIHGQSKNRTMEAPSITTQEQVLNIHKELFRAIAGKVEAPIRQTLQEQFLFTSANGDVQDKTAFIRDFVLHPAIQLPLFVTSDEKVTMLGKTAILTAVAHISIIKGNAPAKDLRERITATYVKQQNQWTLLALQATYIPQ